MIDKKFIINFSALGSSALVNKIINFVQVIFLVRLLTQSDFGLYSLVWAHVGLLAAWQDLGTTAVGILQTGVKNSRVTLNTVFLLRVGISLLVGVVTIVLGVILGYPPAVIAVIAAFIVIYLSDSVSGFFLIICSLKKSLTPPSVFSISFNALRAALVIAVLITTKNIYTALYTIAITHGVYALTLFMVINKKYFTIRWQYSRAALYAVVKKSFVFSLIAFLATVYFKADFVILGKLAGEQTLALYSAAYKFFEVALILIPSYNFSSIPTFKKYFLHHKKKYREKIIGDSVMLLAVSVVVIMAGLTLARPIITLFFSNRYLPSLPLFNILIFSLPFLLLTSVFVNALYAQDKIKQIIPIFAAQVLFNISLNIVFIPLYGAVAPAFITVVGEILNTIVFGSYLFISMRYVYNRR